MTQRRKTEIIDNIFSRDFLSPGTKVPGDERSMERKFQFHGTFVPENKSSQGRKFQGTKVPPYGTFVPGIKDESSIIHIDNTHSYLLHRHGSDMVVQKQDLFKDLGVTFQADLSFKNRIADKINKANCMLSIIKRNF